MIAIPDNATLKWAVESSQARIELATVANLPDGNVLAEDSLKPSEFWAKGKTKFEALKELRRQLIRAHLQMTPEEREEADSRA